MAVYITLTTDPFVENLQRLRDRNDPALARSGRAGLTNVRRPLRGLEIKEDTYASLKVLRSDGTEVPFMDSSDASGYSTSYSNFILQQVAEQRMEKHQIIETFGDTYVYFFGEAPRFLDVTAILINSNDFNWEAEWWANWETTLSGSKSVENGARTYLFYDDNVVEGYMLMSQAQKVSSEPFMVQMSFRMFVASSRNVSSVGDPNFPVHESVNIPPDVSLTSADAFNTLLWYNKAHDGYLSPGQAGSWMDEVIRNSDPRQFGTGARMVDLLRRGTRAIAFPSSVQAYIDGSVESLGVQKTLDLYNSRPIRGLIADNVDEYTGSDPSNQWNDQLPEVYDPRVRGQLEVEDLFQEAIQWMGCFGANINSYGALNGLGMGVNFSAGSGVGIGFGIGAGAGVGTGATFGAVPVAGVGFGGSAGRGFGFGVNAANGYTSNIFPTAPGVAANGYPVGVTPYNPAAAQNVMFSESARWTPQNGLQTGQGDPTYGYPAPYGGPGYGQSGYGDNGGLSYGSSFGATGDPGFLPPSNFSQAGIADTKSDLQRLMTRRPGFGTGLGGVGAGASYAGIGAGSAVSIGGRVTAFSIFAAPGTLNPYGNALTATGRRLGLAERNPYGVPCLGNMGMQSVNLLDML